MRAHGGRAEGLGHNEFNEDQPEDVSWTSYSPS